MYQPLADVLRPTALDDVVGQEALLGPGKLLRRIIECGRVPNLIFYGPSGAGKTTVASIIAAQTKRTLHPSERHQRPPTGGGAGRSSPSRIRFLAPNGVLLYLDEIQYFQQKSSSRRCWSPYREREESR